MKTKPIVAADQPGKIIREAREILESSCSLVIPETYVTEELRTLLREAEGLFSWGNIKLQDDLLSFAPCLRVIGVVGVGCDHVDLESATKRGVVVGNGPGSNAEAVAEYTILLILSLGRDFIRAQGDIKAHTWLTADNYTGLELRGATLGLIGLGHIGRRVAELAQCFGMKVFAFDPYITKDFIKDSNLELTDIKTVLSNADVVSIHVPLNESTRGLIGKREIDVIKHGTLLVNTARAPVVNEEALYNALLSGHIKAAATDVFPKEPPDLSHPIYGLDNFIATPHIAAMTNGAMRDMQVEAAKAIAAVMENKLPRSVVNPAVLNLSRR